LIATDVLSEGINLQDARLLINYDLHWNPVRLMQRIGRVDRRMDSKIEVEIVKHNPSLKTKRIDRDNISSKETKYVENLEKKILSRKRPIYKFIMALK
jgi:superfamily II DNA/RNA helicase